MKFEMCEMKYAMCEMRCVFVRKCVIVTNKSQLNNDTYKTIQTDGNGGLLFDILKVTTRRGNRHLLNGPSIKKENII